MNAKEDRRVKYTKALLKDALVELLQESNISKISVTALCEKAGVHRTTFYAHYTDQYDLLQQIEREILDNIHSYISAPGLDDKQPISVQKLNRILEYGSANAELVKVLLSENGDVSFQKDIMDLVRSISFTSEIKAPDNIKEYVVLYSVSGCVNILRKWLENGMAEPIETMSKMIMQLTQVALLEY